MVINSDRKRFIVQIDWSKFLKVKNFLSLEAYLQIHELKEDKNENLHQRALEIYKAKVDGFIQNKRVESFNIFKQFT